MGIDVSDAQLQETVDCLERHCGNQTAVANELNLSRSTVQNRIKIAARRGISSTLSQIEAMHGHAPDHDLTNTVPAPFIVRGYSTYYDKAGDKAGQWVKTKLDDQKAEAAIRAAIAALSKDTPRAKPVPAPKIVAAHLCNLYTFTDCHVGMRAWKPETGDDWDLEIAERILIGAFRYLIEKSPAAAVCVVNELGDFLHFDSLLPVTPTSGHHLDADSRYSKVVKVATRILRNIIDIALTKHAKVIVLIAEGNHDLASSVWLRHLFGLLYENEPRVEVIDSEMPYYTHQHGDTLLAFHHGHLKKNDLLPMLFAAQFPVEWGATTKRYCHVGHWHHSKETNELGGMRVIQHPTLAARDAYAARYGYVAERSITSITYHAEYGEVETNTVIPEMLEAKEAA